MSKYAKRITKIKKNPANLLAVGSAFGHLEEYIGVFSTIFVLHNLGERIRHKSVVYRDTFESLNHLTEIDFVFVDRDHFNEIKKLHNVLRKSKPIVLTEGSIFKEHTIQRFLNSEQYYAIDVNEYFMIWEQK